MDTTRIKLHLYMLICLHAYWSPTVLITMLLTFSADYENKKYQRDNPLIVIVAIFCVMVLTSVTLWIAVVAVMINPPNGSKCFSLADCSTDVDCYSSWG